MDEQKAVWYLPDEAGQPVGPYASNQILEQLSTGQMPETTLCWREGMPDWQPLTEVEPFAAEIKLTKAAASKRMRRIVIAISCIVCVIAAAAVVYIMMMGPPEVRRAKELMAAGLYTETSEVLGPYVNRNPLNDEAVYLLAIANVNEYVTAKPDRIGLLGGLMGTRTFLEQAKELFARVFKADPKWIDKAKTDIADTVIRIPSDAPDALNRSLEISRLRAELNLADKKQLAGELHKKLVSQGMPQGRYNLNQEAILQTLSWDPSLSGQIITRMLGDENTTPQQLSVTVTLLQRWARERPAFAKILSVELLNRAKLLSDAGRNDQAKILLSNALVIDPTAAKTEEHLLLYIRVMDPGDAKLTRCQMFLKDYPDSPRRLDVLMIIVRDAVAISKQFGRWNRNRAQLYLSAGLSAAKELIIQNPRRSNLDLEVFELAKQHAESKQFNEAIDLTSELIAAVPDSAIKLQIEQAIAEWRVQSGKGTLSPEFDTLAARVEKELKIFSLTTPAAIRSLATNPNAVHVVQVTDGCTVNKFNSEEDEILRRWVADGGILWANNDVLTRFGIKYTAGRWGMAGTRECTPGAVPHPILTGCSRVVATKGSTIAINLSYMNVITLLTSTATYGEEKYTYWSLVPYGNGWVSNVKTVDQMKFDGARFWLNFRLFCLGRDIPGAEGLGVVPGIPTTPAPITPTPAPIQAPNISAPQPARITETANLTKYLADGAGQKIIWVALPRNDIDTETRKVLRNWINKGGTLWVETDLAESFGFGGLRKAESGSLSGRAEVARVQDPMIRGLSGSMLSYELDPNGSTIRSTWSTISKSMRPLLVQPGTQNNIMTVICAARAYGDGLVILRPAKIDFSNQAGRSFESVLNSLSLNPSRYKLQTPAPESRRRTTRPSGRRR